MVYSPTLRLIPPTLAQPHATIAHPAYVPLTCHHPCDLFPVLCTRGIESSPHTSIFLNNLIMLLEKKLHASSARRSHITRTHFLETSGRACILLAWATAIGCDRTPCYVALSVALLRICSCAPSLQPVSVFSLRLRTRLRLNAPPCPPNGCDHRYLLLISTVFVKASFDSEDWEREGKPSLRRPRCDVHAGSKLNQLPSGISYHR
eukprot:107559-Rhodomonas_salina.3